MFFDEICGVVGVLGDCEEKLTVDVARFDSFADLRADAAAPICRDADPASVDFDDLPYETGAARDIVRVRVCFLYEGANPAIGLNLRSGPAGARRIVSTTIFRNEPFES